ncbi:MAG: zinc ribbon domain-containing protein [Treponema sp.]|nr:zinc ribbon domain-containing protein [Treponema sp.]
MYCVECGNKMVGKFCAECGRGIQNNNIQQSQNYTSYKKPAVTHYAPGSYIEKLHSVGSSTLFLVGIILYSVGSIFMTFTALNILTILSMLIIALPITGFWLIFAASKAPKEPEKTFPALTLFKIYIFIIFIASCLIVLSLFIALVTVADTAVNIVPGLFLLLLLGGSILAFSIIYFRLSLSLVSNIWNNIIANLFKPFENIKIFSILTYIGLGISFLIAFISVIVSSLTGNMLNFAQNMILSFTVFSTTTNYALLFFTLIVGAGTVICVIALNIFNNNLLQGETASTYPYDVNVENEKKCASCKMLLNKDAIFCQYCGAEVKVNESEILCSTCGNKVKEQAGIKFCSSCGNNLNLEQRSGGKNGDA